MGNVRRYLTMNKSSFIFLFFTQRTDGDVINFTITLSFTSYGSKSNWWENWWYFKFIQWIKINIQFSCSIVSDSLQSHGLQHAGFPVHKQLLELPQTHAHRVSDAIQPSHPLPCPFPPAFNLSQHQGLFQWVSSSH